MKHVIRVSFLIVMHSWVCAATVVTPKKNDSKVQAVSSHSSVHQPYADHAAVLPRPSADLVEPCSQIASVVYGPQLHAVDLPLAQKQNLISLWNSLYLGYLVRQGGSELFERSGNSKQTIDQYWQALKNPSSQLSTNPFCMYTALKQNPIEIAASKICIDTSSLQTQPIDIGHCRQNLENMYQACSQYQNVLKDLQGYLTSVSDSSWSDVQKNYVTQHMQKAVARMAATCSIQKKGLSCTPQFTGDIRDMGIIVNIQNNTDTTYALIQTSTDGKQAAQIGTLAPGLNNVNLHTAAMIPVTSTAKNKQSAAYHFDIVPMGSASTGQDLFSVKMMSGKELVTLLRSVSNNKKDIFVMNGRQVAKKYAVDEKLDFLVIVQIPKNPTAVVDGIPVGQRIQAFCMSPFTNSVILTMQINEQEITLQSDQQRLKTQNLTSLPNVVHRQLVQQPAFVSAQDLDVKLPLFLLPNFLYKQEVINLYWQVLFTVYIACVTDYQFFEEKCFSNSFIYYDKIGLFDIQRQCRTMIDIYSFFIKNKDMFQVPGVLEVAMFESLSECFSDVTQLAIAQNALGAMVPNVPDGYKMNLSIAFGVDKVKGMLDQQDQQNIWDNYGIPRNNELIFNIDSKSLYEGVFVKLIHEGLDKYKFVFMNKHGVLLGEYYVHGMQIAKAIRVNFLGADQNWVGSDVSKNLIDVSGSVISDFKLICDVNKATKQYILKTSPVLPLDHVDIIHTVIFASYPLKELYFDVFNRYQISSITRCKVIDNGIMPEVLQSLTLSDWSDGIYMVPSVKNNNKLNQDTVGSLDITFYKSDKSTLIGKMNILGINDTTNQKGLLEPVHGYNLGGDPLISQYDIFLSTAILLRYENKT